MPPTPAQREARGARGRAPYSYRGELKRDVASLMYAFGDVVEPHADSVALLEEMTVQFLVDLCHRARPSPTVLPMPTSQSTIQMLATATAPASASASASSSTPQQGSSVSASLSAAGASKSASAPKGGSNSSDLLATTAMPPRGAAHPFGARSRMTVEDIKFALRKDEKLFARVEELLYLEKVINDARKGFTIPEEEAAAANS
ncbi:hypothetical protein FA10DRAFT_182911 [Acaromyces ingoldii]|uniref:Transcription initiation factor TFIID subunit 13 n=1 Tax=Acaromyces ingoldii TaxID=215250 RepID=A0A316YFB6_9BASI|nr:hypothetical protein FA10DRAFT_182911 [Acaromyces ingoldii]PWN87318.1 hypothetical protein FA10DRAFT_182911 [Acaromyces ingoldii]